MLEVANVSKRFDGGFKALRPLSLRVEEGTIVSLVGTSGSGKSTLLRILAGLESPTGGDVTVDGRPVRGPQPQVGVVFQEPRLMPWLNVEDNVRFGLADLPRPERAERSLRLLAKVGLADFARALPRELSGGMAQRVAIARALARQPSVLLLDEPFSALDSFTRLRLQEHLLQLWRDERFTILFVTHDVEEAVALSDRILVLRGSPGGLYRDLPVTLPRPRQRTSAAFQELKQDVLDALELGADDAP